MKTREKNTQANVAPATGWGSYVKGIVLLQLFCGFGNILK